MFNIEAMNDRVKKMKKGIPLATRLRVDIYSNLIINIPPPKNVEEAKKRYELWERSEKITEQIISTVKEWEADGRPGGLG